MDKLIRKVLKTIEKYNMIEKGDMIVLAISGGPDSTCLLDILNQIKEQLKISLMVAHVHHGIRKKEADVEARFIRLKSFHLNLPFQQKSLSVPRMAKEKGLSIEQAGRRARYEFFQELADKYQAQKIALGHHADDQVETILMRLIRGSGLRGLRGIPPKRGVFIRPLIECTREEIELYCKRRKLAFCFDSTNKEPMYLRNKIRYQLIPLLKEEYNPAIKRNLLQLQNIINDELKFWEEIIEHYYLKVLKKECSYCIILDNQILSGLPVGIQRSVIRRTLRHFRIFLEGIQFNHIEAIRLLLLKEEGEKLLDLPDKIRVRKSYQDLIFGFADRIKTSKREEVLEVQEYELTPGQETEIADLKLKFTVQQYDYQPSDYENLIKRSNRNEAYLDYGKLKFPLKVRSRKPGDRFQPLNSLYYKKIKSFFIDQKIDRDTRDKTMLVVDNSDRIAWIAGFQTDNRFKVTNKTKKVLHIRQITI